MSVLIIVSCMNELYEIVMRLSTNYKIDNWKCENKW
jgi:hypothetical protein